MPPAESQSRPLALHIGFTAVIVLMIVVTAVGVERMIKNNNRLEIIVNQYNAKMDLLQTMYTAARERSIVLLRMVNMEDVFDREEQFEYFNELGTKFAVARIALSEKEFDKEEQDLFDQHGEIISRTVPLQMEVIEFLVSDETDAAKSTLLNKAIPSQDQVLSHLQDMLDYQQRSAKLALEEANGTVANTTIFMIAFSTVAVLLSGIIAVAVIRKSRQDEQALKEAHDSLELRVEERTRELTMAYKNLKEHEHDIEEKNIALQSLSNKLSKYLSPQVYASIFSGKQEVRLASRRKKLTVCFSDIAGFAETTDKMESEDLTQLINQYLTEMSKVALQYGATIDKYIGDAIMIFFGDPETRGVKGDAIACVEMAIAMQKRLRELGELWRSVGIDSPLTCRIGIHTGYCTVGNFGSEDRMDYTIIGGTVNLASRLEQAAPKGGILTSYDTYAHVKEAIDCKEAKEIRLAGIAYPVVTYRVLDLKDQSIADDTSISCELPNLKLDINYAEMADEERRMAIEMLQRAVDRLSVRPV